jgi:hypothetical protein
MRNVNGSQGDRLYDDTRFYSQHPEVVTALRSSAYDSVHVSLQTTAMQGDNTHRHCYNAPVGKRRTAEDPTKSRACVRLNGPRRRSTESKPRRVEFCWKHGDIVHIISDELETSSPESSESRESKVWPDAGKLFIGLRCRQWDDQ